MTLDSGHPVQPDPRLQALRGEGRAIALEARINADRESCPIYAKELLRQCAETLDALERILDSQPGVQAVSDAEVEAAMRSWDDEALERDNPFREVVRKVMRAALEAAAKVRSQQ